MIRGLKAAAALGQRREQEDPQRYEGTSDPAAGGKAKRTGHGLLRTSGGAGNPVVRYRTVLYRDWAKTVDVSLRQAHVAGEKMFVDYAGQTIPVVDPSTGHTHQAVLFIAVLGSSNYAYAEPSWDQTLESSIGAGVRAFEFFGGVPRVIVPDNLNSGVRQPDYYEPDLNPTYQEMASHYNAVVDTGTSETS